jgi:hypothetical protein
LPLPKTAKNLQTVDLDCVAKDDVREIGNEWMCCQTLNQPGLRTYFEKAGLSPEDIEASSVTHRKLYRLSRLLYEHRDGIEQYLSHKTSNLSDLQDKIFYTT